MEAPPPKQKCSSSTTSSYDPAHREYLRRQGIDEDLAHVAGVRSLDREAIAGALDWKGPSRSAGLDFPRLAADSRILAHCVRLDAPGPLPKYMASKGPAVPWVPTTEALVQAGLGADALSDCHVPLAVLEGAPSALSLLGAGSLAVGLGGMIAGGHDAERRRKTGQLVVHPQLKERIALRDRPVTILGNANLSSNPVEADATALMFSVLDSEGADVRIALLPPTDQDAGQGPEDYIAVHGAEALRLVLEEAVPADPQRRLRDVLDGLDMPAGATAAERKAVIRDAVNDLLADCRFTGSLHRLSRIAPARFASVVAEIKDRSGLPARPVTQAVRLFAGALATKLREEDDADRMPILLTPDLGQVADMSLRALAKDENVLDFGGQLIEVVGRPGPNDEVVLETPRLTIPRIRDLLSQHAEYRDGTKVRAPPRDIAEVIDARPTWAPVRRMRALLNAPTVNLPSGDIIDKSDYYPKHETLVRLSGAWPTIPREPDQPQVRAAIQRWQHALTDFPLASSRDFSAVMAAMATSAVRSSIGGPVPLFAFDANGAGQGKTRIAEMVGFVTRGRKTRAMPPATRSYVREGAKLDDLVDDEEQRKRTGSLLDEGETLMMIDNASVVGGASLCALLTSPDSYSDRLLTTKRTVRVRSPIMVMATGINLRFTHEAIRRTICVRLRGGDECANRTDFVIGDIDKHISDNRRQLLVDVLTILRGFVVAGSPAPNHAVPGFGSFERWSVIRHAMIWAGLGDPVLKPDGIRDPETDAIETIVRALREWNATSRGASMSSKQIFERATQVGGPPLQAVRHFAGRAGSPDINRLARGIKRSVGTRSAHGVLTSARDHRGVIFYVGLQIGSRGGVDE